MIATHRVKDSNNNTVGFIIDNSFYADYYVKANIDFINNLSLTSRGNIRAKRALDEIQYRQFNLAVYSKLVSDNPFRRDVQTELLKWKRNKHHSVLQLEGSRQIGKTTELKKFAYKNYEYIMYVDLSNDRYNFEDVVNNGCKPMEFEKYCIRAGLPHFVNSSNTAVIIDEIQTKKSVYNSIRNMRDEICCDIIVTGSYLGRILGNNEFFLPAGTINYVFMFTLSFKEFCRVFNSEKLITNIDLYGKSSDKEYRKLEELYRAYSKIGGYPEVVKVFKATRNLDACYSVINKLLYTFKEESRVYLRESREVEIFEHVYREALKEMCSRDNKSNKNIIPVITELTKRSTELTVNKREVSNAVVWLKYAGIVSYCNLAVNGDMRNIAEGRKIYFTDCGVVSYLARQSMLDESSLNGIITETFVYNELHRLFKVDYSERKVIEDEVCYSTYNGYEIDFMVADKNKTVYGIEVKTKDGIPNSLRVFINNKLVDRGIVAKQTHGGHGSNFDTIPIYTVGCRFPY